MDILFVVDDSGSMSEEQTNLASNFPQFINVLDNYMTSSGDALDYRVAVTTTGRDVQYTISFGGITLPFDERGDNGAFRQDCGMTRRWLERGDNNVASTFACAAEVGTGGPSLEMPLEVIDMALSDRMADGTNQGFLRDDALLAIVVLTDEDDCSRTDNNFTIQTDACNASQQSNLVDLSTYLGFLDTTTGNRGRWAMAVLAGAPPSGCTDTAFGDAIGAERLNNFVTMAGQNAVFSSICSGDLSTPLAQALDTFDAACQNFPPIE